MATLVGILGFRGYSGAELVQILSHHPHVEPVLLEHREAEDRPRPLNNNGPRSIQFSAENAKAEGLAAVLMATPPEASMNAAGGLLHAGIKVIDLSGAF